MTRKTSRWILAAMAAMNLVATGLFLAFEDVARDPIPPRDVVGMARWIAVHPADWLTASVLLDRSLDSSLPRRVELWRAAHTLATRLAPARSNASAATVRSGLFHWYELEDRDRRRVIDAVVPLLRDEAMFEQLAEPLWLLTGDFALLRRANPGTPVALGRLRDLAVTHGLFDDYRALRDEVRRARIAALEVKPIPDLSALVPSPVRVADEPLLLRILAILHQRPLESAINADALIDYALRHNLRPLEGLSTAIHSSHIPFPLRARLALALGIPHAAREIELAQSVPGAREWTPYFLDAARAAARVGDTAAGRAYLTRAGHDSATADPTVLAAAVEMTPPEAAAQYRGALISGYAKPREWTGMCGSDICSAATTYVWGTGPTSLDIHAVQSDHVAPYVEVYVDDALVAEGSVAERMTFELPLREGALHVVEVRLANPLTPNRVQRRIALSS